MVEIGKGLVHSLGIEFRFLRNDALTQYERTDLSPVCDNYILSLLYSMSRLKQNFIIHTSLSWNPI